MSNTPEQREFTRIPTALDVDVLIDGKVYQGTTIDVSMKGMLMCGTESIVSGSPCSVVIYLGGRGSAVRIRAAGVVARAIASGVAIEFRELIDTDSYQHLSNLVRYNARDQNQVDNEIGAHLGIKRREG